MRSAALAAIACLALAACRPRETGKAPTVDAGAPAAKPSRALGPAVSAAIAQRRAEAGAAPPEKKGKLKTEKLSIPGIRATEANFGYDQPDTWELYLEEPGLLVSDLGETIPTRDREWREFIYGPLSGNFARQTDSENVEIISPDFARRFNKSILRGH